MVYKHQVLIHLNSKINQIQSGRANTKDINSRKESIRGPESEMAQKNPSFCT